MGTTHHTVGDECTFNGTLFRIRVEIIVALLCFYLFLFWLFNLNLHSWLALRSGIWKIHGKYISERFSPNCFVMTGFLSRIFTVLLLLCTGGKLID